MPEAATKKTSRRPRKCRDCGGSNEVIRGVCEYCDHNYVYCEVCKQDHRRDGELCRHLFWTDCGYAGAGTYETDWKDIKADFFKALDALARIKKPDIDDHPDLITGLRIEIGRHRFWDREEGFMLSTPDLIFYHERPDLAKHRDGKIISLYWARLKASDFSDADLDDEDVRNGMQWLASLCARETKAANRQTVEWIKEWKSFRPEL